MKTTLALALALASLLLSDAARAATVVYHIVINGAQEVPATPSAATGSGTITVDTVNNTLSYNIVFSGLGSDEIMAHIHGFSARGVESGVLHTLPPGSPKMGVWNYSESDEASILAGLTYVNIHSVNIPGGEIRGQIDNPGGEAGFDLNADGQRDVLLQNANGALYVWHVDGARISGGNVSLVSSGSLPQLTDGWDVVPVTADFNGDGKADILVKNTNGALYAWMVDGSAINGGYLSIASHGNLPSLCCGWSVAGAGDFNGDGKTDLLLSNTNGSLYAWMIDGSAISGGNLAIASNGNLPQLSGGWNFAGLGDFNGDGKADILLQNANGALYVWMVDGAAISGGYLSIPTHGALPQLTGGWGIGGIGDFNGDGKADLLIQHSGGALYAWMIDGNAIGGGYLSIPTHGSLPALSGGWSLGGLGDFNADGKGDILLTNTGGAVYLWTIDGSVISGGSLSIPTEGNLPALSGGWVTKFMR